MKYLFMIFWSFLIYADTPPNGSIGSYPNIIELDWCSCFGRKRRLDFVKKVADSVVRVFPPNTITPKNPLVYTSMASGGLKQDYHTIELLLKRGYKNMTVNVIDGLYGTTLTLSLSKENEASFQKRFRDALQEETVNRISALNKQLAMIDKLIDTRIEQLGHKNKKSWTDDLEYNRYNDQYWYYYGMLEDLEKNNPEESMLYNALVAEQRARLFARMLSGLAKKYKASVTVLPYASAYEYINIASQKGFNKSQVLLMVDPDFILYPAPYVAEANVLKVDKLYYFRSQVDGKLYVPSTLLPLEGNNVLIREMVQDMPSISKLYQKLEESAENSLRHLSETDIEQEGAIQKYMSTWVSLLTSPYIAMQDLVRATAHPKAVLFIMEKDPARHYDLIKDYKKNIKKYLQADVITPYMDALIKDKKSKYVPV